MAVKEIELGSKVKDTISGFTGIATSRTLFLTGCARIGIQPKIKEDGTLPELQVFDEDQLKVIKPPPGSKKPERDDGGPHSFEDKITKR